MPKQKSKKDDGNNNKDDILGLLEKMPLAKAVYQQDVMALTELLQKSLPNANAVDRVTLEKSVGEAFTGGRSTPVYYVTAQVTNHKNVVRERCFVIKLVLLPGSDDDSSLQQKRESYAIERRFYEIVAPRLRPILAIPKLLASDDANKKNHQAHPIACWLMTDLRVQFPLHPTVLDSKSHMMSALDWLAQFHAHSWNSNNADWRRSLWERGGFWNKQQQIGNNLSTCWMSSCQWLAKKHPDRMTSNTKTLGSRFHSLCEPLSEFMKLQSKTKHRSTMIHGDYKAANLFFSEASTAAAVDFQYTGAGVPSEDVAYFLFPDALADYWDEESDILEYYHRQLLELLIQTNKGGPSSFPLSVFSALYQLSRIELVIYWLQKGWVGSTKGDAKLITVLEQAMDQLDGGTALSTKGEYRRALEDFCH